MTVLQNKPYTRTLHLYILIISAYLIVCTILFFANEHLEKFKKTWKNVHHSMVWKHIDMQQFVDKRHTTGSKSGRVPYVEK